MGLVQFKLQVICWPWILLSKDGAIWRMICCITIGYVHCALAANRKPSWPIENSCVCWTYLYLTPSLHFLWCKLQGESPNSNNTNNMWSGHLLVTTNTGRLCPTQRNTKVLDGNLQVSRKRLHRLFFSQPQRVLTNGFGKDLRDVWVGEKQCGFAMLCNYLVHHIWGTRCSTLKFWCERPTTFYNNNQRPTTTGLKISNECDDSTWTSTPHERQLWGFNKSSSMEPQGSA